MGNASFTIDSAAEEKEERQSTCKTPTRSFCLLLLLSALRPSVVHILRRQRRAQCKLLVEEMRKAREDMVGMIHDLKDKQERSHILAEEMSKLPKNINRYDGLEAAAEICTGSR